MYGSMLLDQVYIKDNNFFHLLEEGFVRWSPTSPPLPTLYFTGIDRLLIIPRYRNHSKPVAAVGPTTISVMASHESQTELSCGAIGSQPAPEGHNCGNHSGNEQSKFLAGSLEGGSYRSLGH